MPLPPAPERDLMHTRVVECKGYRRADGLWDIEGHMTDRKSYDFANVSRGVIKAGEPVHEMWLRLTLDDDMQVKAVAACTDNSPFPATCPHIADAYQKLVGLSIGPGWSRAVKERLGGIDGCTHLSELLGPLATTAFQTIFPLRGRRDPMVLPPPASADKPFVLLNTCHAFRADSPVVQQIAPGHYSAQPPAPREISKKPEK